MYERSKQISSHQFIKMMLPLLGYNNQKKKGGIMEHNVENYLKPNKFKHEFIKYNISIKPLIECNTIFKPELFDIIHIDYNS